MLPGGVCFGKAGNVDLKIAEVVAVVVIMLLTEVCERPLIF